MLYGRIHSVESCGGVDGPGIRFVVFFQGCLLRCKYCHNRDTWPRDRGQLISSEALLKEALSYRSYLQASGGGVTATGGEPTLQAEFLTEFFSACKKEGLHTCLDTNGAITKITPTIEALLSVTDLVMLDIKQMDPEKHRALVGVDNHIILKFAEYLHKRQKPFWIRYVVVPGYTDHPEDIAKLGAFLQPFNSLEKIELHAYHDLGKFKWSLMNDPYSLENVQSPSKESLEQIRSILGSYGHHHVCY